jgi:hypothetical protein
MQVRHGKAREYYSKTIAKSYFSINLDPTEVVDIAVQNRTEHTNASNQKQKI